MKIPTNADISAVSVVLTVPWRPYSCRYPRGASPESVAQDFLDLEGKNPANVSMATLTAFIRA